MYTLSLLHILHLEKIFEFLIYNINSFLQKKIWHKIKGWLGEMRSLNEAQFMKKGKNE